MKSCEHCGGHVTERPNKPNKFCSTKCGCQHSSTKIELVCTGCGNKFMGYEGRTFCTLKCVHDSMRLPECACKGCGVMFAPEKSTTKYHSKECEVSSRRGEVVFPDPIAGASWVALTKGKFALIDDQDFLEVSKHSWCADEGKSTWYARAFERRPDGRTKLSLHRFVLGAVDPKMEVDHINGDGLDCRRSNLRIVSRSGNQMNTGKKRGGSIYKGVAVLPNGKFKATIRANNVNKHLGTFFDEQDAALAYDEAARTMHGAHGRYNFPKDGEQSAV